MIGKTTANNVVDLMNASSMKTSTSKADSKSTESVSFDTILSQRSYKNNDQTKDFDLNKNEKISSTKSTKDTTKVKQVKTTNDTAKLKNQKTDTKNVDASKSNTVKNPKDEVIDETIDKVKEMVKDVLNVTDEELASLMETLGLSMIDLLNPDALKLLTLANAGTTDPTMLLTEDGLGQQLNDLLNQLNEIMKQSDITNEDISAYVPKEDAKVLVEPEIMEDVATQVQEVTENKTTVKEDAPVQKNEDKAQESQVQFTVVKEDSTESEVTKTSTDTSSNQDQQKSATSEADLVNQLFDHIANATKDVSEANFSENLSKIHELREITNQIIDQIKLTIKPTQTSMEFTLNPEHLGRVGLSITSKEGIITASFTASNQIAKEAIESQMQVLKDNLNEQGIKVEAIEVMVGEPGLNKNSDMNQSNNQQNQTSSNSRKHFRYDTEDVVEEETETENKVSLEESGTQIDYSA